MKRAPSLTKVALRLVALVVLAGVFVCCGGGGGGPQTVNGLVVGPPPSGRVYVVTVASFPDSRLGEYDEVGGDGFVRILAAILQNTTLAERTIMHELGHAAGLGHTPGSGCIMDQTAYSIPSTSPCGSEVGGLAPVTLQVYSGVTPGLFPLVGSACTGWNQAAGRLVFQSN